MERKKIFLIIAILLTLLIILGSLTSPSNLSVKTIKISDKVIHFVAYFVLSASWFLALKKTKTNYIIISIAVILFGILIEVLQKILTTNRYLEYLDMVANTLGVLLTYLLFTLKCKKKVMN